MSQEALLSVQMTDISIVSTLRSNHLLLRDTEIISWKVCTNNNCFHSQVAMHQKRKNEWVQQKKWGFLIPLNKWIKTVQALSMVGCFYIMHTEIYTVKYKAKNVKIIALPIRDTNDSTSLCKSKYIHGTQ